MGCRGQIFTQEIDGYDNVTLEIKGFAFDQKIINILYINIGLKGELYRKGLVYSFIAKEKNLPLVIATTGQTDEEKSMINEASKSIPVFFAANYSIGIAVLIKEAKNIARIMKDADIEIIETHHNRKLDAPSGTALKIADELKTVRTNANLVLGRSGNKKREKNDIGINAIRLGNVVGVHEVLISTEHECLSIKHEAYDRGLFAEGAINAIKFMKDKKAGLYGMNYMLNL